jgi:predicted nicotinamide N-methyase
MRLHGFDERDLTVREVAVRGRTIRLLAPRDPEGLLDRIDPDAFARDERMPYWGELWPAALGLADHLLAPGAPVLLGEEVIELGAGLGLGGIAAALAGAREVVFTDYFEESLAFAAENARRNGIGRFSARHFDWRAPETLGRTFRVAVGSDLLYERRNQEPLARALATVLAPGGWALIADPGRSTAAGFAAVAAARGLSLAREASVAAGRIEVAIFRVSREA